MDFSEWVYVKIDLVTEKVEAISDSDIVALHSKLQIHHGSFSEELPEQLMSFHYLTGNEKILEIGGNIGRNSMIISSILKQKDNFDFVCMESDYNIAQQLQENRDINQLSFHIENSALSKRRLIQRGWDTIVSEILLDGYKNVETITWHELNQKYNISFDTLVLDCEGAFYYILLDMPEILDNIRLIIMENDYIDISKKQYINEIMINVGFKRIYFEAGGWGPCSEFFFEVWKKE